MINSFDIDGVIFLGDLGGIYPGPKDIIITGRSFEEEAETLSMLNEKGIKNPVFFNPLRFNEKTRITSGRHKAKILNWFMQLGGNIGFHIDDDPIQINEIKKMHPLLPVILMQHDLVEKENVRHLI